MARSWAMRPHTSPNMPRRGCRPTDAKALTYVNEPFRGTAYPRNESNEGRLGVPRVSWPVQ